MNSFKNRYNSKSGFTVIEILVSIFILTLIGLAVSSFAKDIFSLNRITSDSLTAQDEARRALKSMSAEIRVASPSSLGAYAIAQTATSSFTFYSNADDDSFKERVRYFLDGTTLKKGIIKPSGTPLTYNPTNEVVNELIHGVANATTSIFSYYDKNYDGTTQALIEPIDIATVRLVKITVVIDKDPQTPPGPMTLTTQISIRNLKDNL
jgi:type II secretory pathway pseudopilin PulG